MDTMERFMAYASDFEISYKDDDWDRIKSHFTDDAVYEVDSKVFGSTMRGPDAITAGLKKSLDGFDRRFDTRTIEVIGQPEIDGDEIRIQWSVGYTKAGYEPYVLRGRSTTRVRDGRIAYLADHYDAAADQSIADWQSGNDLAIDLSYT